MENKTKTVKAIRLKKETKKVLSNVIILEKKSPDYIWKFGKDQQVQMSEMSTVWMKSSKTSLQERILFYADKIARLQSLVDQLEEVAGYKGVELPEYDKGYFKNDKKIREAKLK